MFEILNRPYADPSAFFLATSPWPMAVIVAFYMMFVLKLGRKFMAERKAYDLRAVLKVYNLIQIAFNALLFLTVSLIHGKLEGKAVYNNLSTCRQFVI